MDDIDTVSEMEYNTDNDTVSERGEGEQEHEKNTGSQLALYPIPVTVIGVLFEFTAYEYLKTGEVIGKCLSFKNGESI